MRWRVRRSVLWGPTEVPQLQFSSEDKVDDGAERFPANLKKPSLECSKGEILAHYPEVVVGLGIEVSSSVVLCN